MTAPPTSSTDDAAQIRRRQVELQREIARLTSAPGWEVFGRQRRRRSRKLDEKLAEFDRLEQLRSALTSDE